MKAQITQRTIKELKAPSQGNAIVWDREIHGFGLRITGAGAVAFILDYRFHRRKRRYTIGRHPELSATAARSEALKLLDGIRNGIDPLEKRQQEYAAPTMKDLAAEYLSRYAKKKKRRGSIRNDKGMLDNIVLPRLGALRTNAVNRRDIEALHASLEPTPYHANRVVSLLSRMLTLAIEWGYRADNPARGFTRYDEPKRERWLPAEELRRFSDALDSYHDQRAADALRLLMLTGAREQEALGADWTQFDLARGEWTKPAHCTKENKIAHVPLNDYALALLRKMHTQSGGRGPLFPGASGKARVTIRRPFIQVCKAAGLAEPYSAKGKRRTITRYKPTLRIHDLRHSFASHLVSDGVDLGQVGKLMGHTRPDTTQRYAHYASEALRAASNRFGKVFEPANRKQP